MGKTKNHAPLKCWVILYEDGSIARWAGAFPDRKQAWVKAAYGMLSSSEYDSLDEDGRKRSLQKRGVRVVRAVLTLEGL